MFKKVVKNENGLTQIDYLLFIWGNRKIVWKEG